MTQLTLDQAYQQAVEGYLRGDTANAETLCSHIVRLAPGHIGAATLGALIAARQGRADEGEAVLRAAAERPAPTITLDFAPPAAGRHHEEPNGLLRTLLEPDVPRYLDAFGQAARYLPALQRIPVERAADDTPYWNNEWLYALDAVSLYTWLAARRPARYVEVGSGNSTKFAWRAIADEHLPTILCSIDPEPRAEVDELCDSIVREPLERADLSVFANLKAGDVVFLDSSHRTFMGSDVTVFFTEVLPALAPGVLVGIHDIFLPYDYPTGWTGRYYSEQYLLAAFLLARAPFIRVALPLHFLARHAEARAGLQAFCDALPGKPEATGSAFWLEIV